MKLGLVTYNMAKDWGKAMLAYHETLRKQGASYARKYRPDQHHGHLWRQCRNRFADLGGWPLR